MSIPLPIMLFKWNVRLLSASVLTGVNVIIWTRERGMCICSDVEAFFLFLLGSAASRRLFCDIGQNLLCSHKQNLSE